MSLFELQTQLEDAQERYAHAMETNDWKRAVLALGRIFELKLIIHDHRIDERINAHDEAQRLP